VPGMVAVQHSGSGKANQYFLRGFNLDHGFDFTTYIDGVPWNLRSHGHGQGYLDVNGLMPETVERMDYRKGPYRADVGDFAMAGASFISTIDRLDAPFAALEGGEFGITANAICPAYVRTPLVDNQIADQAKANNMSPAEVIEKIMLAPAAVKRLIEPAEVAGFVAYLCSDAAGVITGSALTMDLGWTAR